LCRHMESIIRLQETSKASAPRHQQRSPADRLMSPRHLQDAHNPASRQRIVEQGARPGLGVHDLDREAVPVPRSSPPTIFAPISKFGRAANCYRRVPVWHMKSTAKPVPRPTPRAAARRRPRRRPLPDSSTGCGASDNLPSFIRSAHHRQRPRSASCRHPTRLSTLGRLREDSCHHAGNGAALPKPAEKQAADGFVGIDRCLIVRHIGQLRRQHLDRHTITYNPQPRKLPSSRARSPLAMLTCVRLRPFRRTSPTLLTKTIAMAPSNPALLRTVLSTAATPAGPFPVPPVDLISETLAVPPPVSSAFARETAANAPSAVAVHSVLSTSASSCA